MRDAESVTAAGFGATELTSIIAVTTWNRTVAAQRGGSALRRDRVLTGRRRESFLETLFVMPWWVGVGFGILGFFGIGYVIPAYFNSASSLLKGANTGLQPVARFWLGLCLSTALVSFVRARFVARKFDQQKSIDDFRSLSWRQFESIVGEAFRRRGFSVLENVFDGPDGGVDLVLRKNGEKHFVQCKQWKVFKVGVKPIRELYGVAKANDAAGGLFVTSGSYTADALEFGKRCGIEMIDGDALVQMIGDAQQPALQFDPTTPKRDTSHWSVPASADSPNCPKCGAAMVGRTATRGENVGKSFWGCTTYPKCRGTREI